MKSDPYFNHEWELYKKTIIEMQRSIIILQSEIKKLKEEVYDKKTVERLRGY